MGRPNGYLSVFVDLPDRLVQIILSKCTLRPWSLDDKASLVRHANNRNIWRTLRDRFPFPYTEDDADEWLFRAANEQPQTSFAIEVDDKAVGGIGIHLQTDVHRRSAEIGFWLGQTCWGRGIMTEAVRELTPYAFQHFDLCRLYAFVFSPNRASARVLEKAGYQLEGIMRKSVIKDGQILDQLLYACVR